MYESEEGERERERESDRDIDRDGDREEGRVGKGTCLRAHTGKKCKIANIYCAFCCYADRWLNRAD